MSPRTNEDFEAIRKERKAEIQETAMKLFAEKGFENTSISQIAKTAGISNGLLYNYFESKEKLLEEMIFEVLENLFPKAIELFKKEEDPKKGLRALIDFNKKLMTENLDFWRLYVRLYVQVHRYPNIAARTVQLVADYSKEMFILLKKLGYENPEIPAYRLGYMLDGIGLNFVNFPNYPLDAMLDDLYDLFILDVERNGQKES